ncbi:MAG: hypothetical protein DHS80DRAFT_28405 [Piptocephalis tieghemiana]|nr:MAG: hypothetical protein DHS80DRAFT_28405 [Piptocephalis tieghemiana]
MTQPNAQTTQDDPSSTLWINPSNSTSQDIQEPLTPASLFARLTELKELQTAGLALISPSLSPIRENPSVPSTAGTETSFEEDGEDVEGDQGGMDSIKRASLSSSSSTFDISSLSLTDHAAERTLDRSSSSKSSSRSSSPSLSSSKSTSRSASPDHHASDTKDLKLQGTSTDQQDRESSPILVTNTPAILIPASPSPPTGSVQRIQDVVLRMTYMVRTTLDGLGEDLAVYLGATDFANAALAKMRVSGDSYVVSALKERVRWVVEAEVVRELQLRYAQTKEIVTESIHRDVEEVFSRADLLTGDMEELEEKWDSVALAIEEYVLDRVRLIMDTMSLWITQTIPNLIQSLIEAWVIGEGALLRPIYDRVVEGLLPVVKGIIDSFMEGLRLRRSAFETTVVSRVREDLEKMRQHMRM